MSCPSRAKPSQQRPPEPLPYEGVWRFTAAAVDASVPQARRAVRELLARQGVNIARRTVAKYREQMSIAPARERRRGTAPLLARAG